MKLGSLTVLFVLAIPTGAHAYKFVDSSSVRLSENTYLLTHTYTAGFLNVEASTPIVARMDNQAEEEYPTVGFSVKGVNDAALKGATINALVLSNSAIDKNKYQMTAGKRSTFTLFSLVTLTNPVENASDLSLSIQSLPFSYNKKGEEKTILYVNGVSAQ